MLLIFLNVIRRAAPQFPSIRRITSVSSRITGDEPRLQHQSSSGHFMQLPSSSGLPKFRYWLPPGGQRVDLQCSLASGIVVQLAQTQRLSETRLPLSSARDRAHLQH
jgi:hypothetical protein